MDKYRVTISPCNDTWLWTDGDWKEFVCSDFDENIVLVGNTRDTSNIELASWWNKAKNIIEEVNNYYGDREEFLNIFSDKYSEEMLKRVYQAFDAARRTDTPEDSSEFITEIALIVNPGLELDSYTIKGNIQGDWKTCICVRNSVNFDLLADWFFGNIIDVFCENIDGDNTFSAHLTQTEWCKYDGDELKKFLKNFLELPDDAEVTFQEFDGYIQTPKYREF